MANMFLLAGLLLTSPFTDQSFRPFAKPLDGREWSGAIEAPAALGWRTNIAPADERGDKLVISGTIYRPDGRTPASGAMLYVYHTDADGIYSRGSGRGTGPRHGKLRGWMLTGTDGKYEFHTIKPAPYPSRDAPAHIHPTLTAKDFPEHYVDEYWFEGDSLIPAGAKERHRNDGRFNPILKLTRDRQGVWRGVRDLKLQPPSRSNGGA